MLNVIQPGLVVAPHRHLDTGELCVCIYGAVIERFFDEQSIKPNPSPSQSEVIAQAFSFLLFSFILWRQLAEWLSLLEPRLVDMTNVVMNTLKQSN